MASHLERRSPNQVETANSGSGVVDAGQAAEVTEMNFGGRVLDHSADMPRAFRQGAKASTQLGLQTGGGRASSGGELIVADPASLARITHSEAAARNSGGTSSPVRATLALILVIACAGRMAPSHCVILTVAERGLKKNANRLSPAGPWYRGTYVHGSQASAHGCGPHEPHLGAKQRKARQAARYMGEVP